jgi:hypothetical protein
LSEAQGLALLNPTVRARGGLGLVQAGMILLLLPATCSHQATLWMCMAAGARLLSRLLLLLLEWMAVMVATSSSSHSSGSRHSSNTVWMLAASSRTLQ